jgi:hypothetical protein
MARGSLQAESAISNKCTPARAARYALAVGTAAKQALATLQAIDDGDMLTASPSDREDARRQETALTLLDAAQRQLSRVLADDAGETALLLLAGNLTGADATFAETLAELERLNADLGKADPADEPTIDRLAEARYDAMSRLIDLPAPDMAGMKAKLAAFWVDGGDYTDAAAFQAKIMADLTRLAASHA